MAAYSFVQCDNCGNRSPQVKMRDWNALRAENVKLDWRRVQVGQRVIDLCPACAPMQATFVERLKGRRENS